MLSLSRKTDYALVAMIALARRAPELLSARQIAQENRLPPSMLMNIMKEMLVGGLVTSVRGIYGGYRLSRPAEQITLGQIIEAAEGVVRLVRCCGDDQNQVSADREKEKCSRGNFCPAGEPLRRVDNLLQIFMGQITLADLMCAEIPMLIKVGLQPASVTTSLVTAVV